MSRPLFLHLLSFQILCCFVWIGRTRHWTDHVNVFKTTFMKEVAKNISNSNISENVLLLRRFTPDTFGAKSKWLFFLQETSCNKKVMAKKECPAKENGKIFMCTVFIRKHHDPWEETEGEVLNYTCRATGDSEFDFNYAKDIFHDKIKTIIVPFVEKEIKSEHRIELVRVLAAKRKLTTQLEDRLTIEFKESNCLLTEQTCIPKTYSTHFVCKLTASYPPWKFNTTKVKLNSQCPAALKDKQL